jgi:hypothetical protein
MCRSTAAQVLAVFVDLQLPVAAATSRPVGSHTAHYDTPAADVTLTVTCCPTAAQVLAIDFKNIKIKSHRHYSM